MMETEKEKWKGGSVAMGDHPSDSGTEMLGGEREQISVSYSKSVEIFLPVSARTKSWVCVRRHIMCVNVSLSSCVHLYVCLPLTNSSVMFDF